MIFVYKISKNLQKSTSSNMLQDKGSKNLLSFYILAMKKWNFKQQCNLQYHQKA